MKFNNFNFRFLKKRTLAFILTFIIGSLLFNCKKESNQEPIISINLPQSGTLIRAGDSIHVDVNISDDNELLTVSVQLVYLDESPASSAIVYHPANNTFHISTLYHVDNTLLEGGTYYLRISATDGSLSAREVIEILIQPIPIDRLKVFCLTNSANQVQVYDLDWTLGPILYTSLIGDYRSSSLSSYFKRLNILTGTYGILTILDAMSGSIVNEVSGNCPISTPCFNNLEFKSELNFVSHYDGNIKGFDSNGLQKFEVQQDGYFRADAMLLDEDKFFAELDYINPQVKKLGTFFYPSGVATLEASIDMDIIKMFKRSQDEIFLLGHKNGSCVIEVFNKSTNRATLLRNLGSMTLHSAYILQSTNILLASNQGLWNYNISLNSISLIRPNELQCVVYDPIYSEYFIAEQNIIRVLDATTFQEKKSYSLPDSVVSIHFLNSR